jgi:hypothetical protein
MVAMGKQWAHAKFFSQSEGLSVVNFGFFDMRWIALRRDVAEEAQGPCLMATFLVRPGELDCLPGEVHGFILTASHQGDLTQPGEVLRFATSARLEGPQSIACSNSGRASVIRPDSA